MLPFFILINVFYCAALVWLYHHWQRIPLQNNAVPITAESPLRLTVVIPVRNEAANITALLEDLSAQQGVPNAFDIIIVDDYSTDETRTLVEQFQQQKSCLVRLLSLNVPPGFIGSHKKLAITQAIATTQHEIIVTTDGDCRVGPYWLATIWQCFEERSAVLVSGGVTFQQGSFFQRLQTIEFASLIGVGAACLQAGYPNMANGANLAFLHEVFEQVEGYGGNLHIPSGDDEFLLQKIAKRCPYHLFFLKHPAAVVTTQAQRTLYGFYQQRKRWASKWKLHRDKKVAALAVFIFLYHICILASVLLVGLGTYGGSLLLFLLPKIILEFVFLRSVLLFLDKKLPPSSFLLLQLIYPFYAIFFGIGANLGRYTWKDRTYSP